MLLAITTDTWIVTGLGFGIVLLLLLCLVFILQGFGWTMQKISEPRAPKAEAPKAAPAKSAEPTDEGTKAAIAMALACADNEDEAAIAYALYLAHHSRHDMATSMINLRGNISAWNEKTFGLNNKGF